MAFKLIESAQTRWRMVNTPHLVALVRAGVPFTNGKQVERSDQSNTEPNAAEHAYPQVLTIPPLQTWDRQRLIEYRRGCWASRSAHLRSPGPHRRTPAVHP